MSAAVDSPLYLLLLLLVPVFWLLSFRSLAALGFWRRLAALAIRTAVFLALVLALAEFQWVSSTQRMTVLYLLDQSLSIPEPQRKAMSEYVNAEVAKHRNPQTRDRAGVIVFARQAAVEYPAVEQSVQLKGAIEAPLDPEYSDLSAAMKLAQAAFPADSANRIVVISDGNENLGDALAEAQSLSARGVGIDVAPVRYAARSEVAVEKIVSPSDAQRGQPFDLKIVLKNLADKNPNGAKPGEKAAGEHPVAGRLRVYRRTKDQDQLLADQSVTVEPGKRVFTIRETIDAPDFYTYEARFTPDDPASDALSQNNAATGFTQVRGQGRVLFIQDFDHRGEFDKFIDHLRQANLTVVTMNTNELFTSLADLQPFDTVILADAPREAFTDAQIKMLATNTEQMGAGLVMLGGPNSFGAGGWAETEVEAAMPVDFRILNAKVVPVGALALVIDVSGSMSGEKLDMARGAAMAAVDVLSPRDYVSVTAFDSEAHVISPMVRVDRRAQVRSRISHLAIGGGTFMEPGIIMGRNSLSKATDAAIRHMIILTDGQSAGTGYEALMSRYRKQGITVSTVAVGGDADIRLLKRMAASGGGKFTHATTPKMLPKIFQQEARMVSRPLVFEPGGGMVPHVTFPHEMLRGVDGALPPITGYVLTQVKDNPLVEVSILAPKPVEKEYQTVLASWTFGLGKAVAFTTDVTGRWTGAWTDWATHDKFFSQMVRWSMRPVDNQGVFNVTTDIRNGRAEVLIDAFDRDQSFQNGLNMTARVVGPDLQPLELPIRQTGPGRYVGNFPADGAGSYLLSIVPGIGAAPLTSGINVPYSPEYLNRESNEPLLAALAGLMPPGGEAGELIDDRDRRGIGALAGDGSTGTGDANATSSGANAPALGSSGHEPPSEALQELLSHDTFRHTLAEATSRQDAWPWLLVLTCCLFLTDVFVRRVQIDFAWVPHYLAIARDRVLRRAAVVAAPVTISRLKSRKLEVTDAIEGRRATARFEPPAPAGNALSNSSSSGIPVADPLATLPEAPANASPQATGAGQGAAKAEESYTSRLLKAKKKVWEERK